MRTPTNPIPIINILFLVFLHQTIHEVLLIGFFIKLLILLIKVYNLINALPPLTLSSSVGKHINNDKKSTSKIGSNISP